MQFYDVIENRTSIKRFKNNEIPRERIERMVTAAMMSPSWRNNSCYRFIIVDDKNLLQQLSETVNNNSDDASEAVREAPVAAVVVADPTQSGTVDGRDYYMVDAAIAMEHFILAATEEGYGTCWIGAVNEDKVRDLLDIPKSIRVVAMTPVGETAEKKAHYEKKPLRDFVFLNAWNKTFNDEVSSLKN